MTKTYSQKLLDTAKHATKVDKKFLTDALKTASKRAIQEIAEVTSDLIGNKIADEIKTVSKFLQNNLDEVKSGKKNTKRKKCLSRKKTTNY